MAIKYKDVREEHFRQDKIPMHLYPPIMVGKRNKNSVLSVKIYDVEMMINILRENFFFDKVGSPQFIFDIRYSDNTGRVYTICDTRNFEVLFGRENPNYLFIHPEKRDAARAKWSEGH